MVAWWSSNGYDPTVSNATHEVLMKDENEPGENAKTPEPESADKAVDQKNVHSDNDNEFSPGFKPDPDRPKPGDDTDADIDTDGG
ncbi:hypothetical protein [Pseudomonas sp. PLMAX]|uniref:hypothetical protein n=1 Tax=Pseudomonas sp. PLMAX TaxID=2201998 RepID=UPI0038BB7EA8